MAKAQASTARLQVMLATKTHDFLAALAAKGTHGASATDVAKTLIEDGIRTAIKDGFVSQTDIKSTVASDR